MATQWVANWSEQFATRRVANSIGIRHIVLTERTTCPRAASRISSMHSIKTSGASSAEDCVAGGDTILVSVFFAIAVLLSVQPAASSIKE